MELTPCLISIIDLNFYDTVPSSYPLANILKKTLLKYTRLVQWLEHCTDSGFNSASYLC